MSKTLVMPPALFHPEPCVVITAEALPPGDASVRRIIRHLRRLGIESVVTRRPEVLLDRPSPLVIVVFPPLLGSYRYFIEKVLASAHFGRILFVDLRPPAAGDPFGMRAAIAEDGFTVRSLGEFLAGVEDELIAPVTRLELPGIHEFRQPRVPIWLSRTLIFGALLAASAGLVVFVTIGPLDAGVSIVLGIFGYVCVLLGAGISFRSGRVSDESRLPERRIEAICSLIIVTQFSEPFTVMDVHARVKDAVAETWFKFGEVTMAVGKLVMTGVLVRESAGRFRFKTSNQDRQSALNETDDKSSGEADDKSSGEADDKSSS